MQFVVIGVAAVGVFTVLSGLHKMVTRRGTSYSWHFEPPAYAVREQYDQSGFRAFVGGLFRVAIGGAIIVGAAAIAGV